MDTLHRQVVELARGAGSITLILNEGGGKSEEVTLKWDSRQYDIRKLRHDIALAIQDFFNKQERKQYYEHTGRRL